MEHKRKMDEENEKAVKYIMRTKYKIIIIVIGTCQFLEVNPGLNSLKKFRFSVRPVLMTFMFLVRIFPHNHAAGQ